MTSTSDQLPPLFDQIRDILITNGIDYWKAVESVQFLDNFVSMEIALKHLETIPDEKQSILSKLVEKETVFTKKLGLIGLDEEQFNRQKVAKLQNYIEILQSVHL